jgi:hypothetical protein
VLTSPFAHFLTKSPREVRGREKLHLEGFAAPKTFLRINGHSMSAFEQAPKGKLEGKK